MIFLHLFLKNKSGSIIKIESYFSYKCLLSHLKDRCSGLESVLRVGEQVREVSMPMTSYPRKAIYTQKTAGGYGN